MKEVDIFSCAESWLKPGVSFCFFGFKVFRRDRLEPDGSGIVFLVRNNLAFLVIQQLRGHH